MGRPFTSGRKSVAPSRRTSFAGKRRTPRKKRDGAGKLAAVVVGVVVIAAALYFAGTRYLGREKVYTVTLGGMEMRVPAPEGAEYLPDKTAQDAFMTLKLTFANANKREEEYLVYALGEMNGLGGSLDFASFQRETPTMKKMFSVLNSGDKQPLKQLLAQNARNEAAFEEVDLDFIEESDAFMVRIFGTGTVHGKRSSAISFRCTAVLATKCTCCS